MYLFCSVFATLLLTTAAGLSRPRFCPYGHKNRFLKRLGSWTISLRGLCYDCGQGGRFGNARGGRHRRQQAVLQAHAGNVARSVRAKYAEYTQQKAKDVLYVEVWADRRSNVSEVAAREGSWVVRVSEPSDTTPKSQQLPTLLRGIACTIWLDLDNAVDKAQLEHWLPMLVQRCAPRRVVMLTSPCCRMHCRMQATNVAQWKQNMTAAAFKERMAVFLKHRRAARNAVRFAGRLHSLVDSACTDYSAATRQIQCVHLHEQPSTARMARMSARADRLTGNVWPAAWTPLGDHANVALCAVGYGPQTWKRFGKQWRFQILGCAPLLAVLRTCQCQCSEPHDACQGTDLKGTAFYSKALAYYVVLGARCS